MADRVVVAAVALALLLGVTGCGSGTSQGDTSHGPVANFTVHDDDGFNGAVLGTAYRVPDVALTDTEGAAYSLRKDTTRPLTLVFFGYTHCPDVCQAVMADIASAMNRLDDAHRAKVAMVFVTSDPARDDPKTLRAYLDRFDPGFEGLTGRLSKIVTVATALGVPIERGATLPSGGYEVGHGSQIVGVEDGVKAPIVWTEGTSAAGLAADITKLVDQLSTGSTTDGSSS